MTSLATAMASESIDWMADRQPDRDPTGDLCAFTMATFVDGVAITPRGFDVTGEFDGVAQ